MRRAFQILLAALFAALLSGCKEHCGGHGHGGEDHHHHDSAAEPHGHHEDASGARYDKEHGLEFSEETAKAIGIKSQKPEIRNFKAATLLTGQVVSTGPLVVNARVPLERADALKDFLPANGKLLRIDRLSGEVSGLADLLYELAADKGAKIGDFIEIKLESPERRRLVLPSQAVLRTLEGSHVYRVNEGAYLRTSVQTGLESEGFIEILGGIDENSELVVSPAVQLWLVELRLTKGGGHSH